MRPRAVLADDHLMVRAGLRKLLESFDIEVVGEAADGRQALSLIASQRPDVALLDIAMSGLNGIEAAARIAHDHPHTRVLILSMHQNEDYVRRALRAGAAGYLVKDAAPAELELALKAVLRGETYLSPAVSKGVMNDYVRRLRDEKTPGAALTARQREILQLIAEGRSTKEIARLLNVSVKTIETHRAQLMERLGIHDVAGLVRHAILIGLISVEK